MARVRDRIIWLWQLTRFSWIVMIFNTGYLLLNVQQWSSSGQWWGYAAIMFWLVLCLSNAYNLGKQRVLKAATELLAAQQGLIDLQKQALDQTLVVPVVTLHVVDMTSDEPQEAQLRLGPICLN